MTKEKFHAEWEPAQGLPNAFTYRRASYWKGQKGWWASRGDGSEMHGPFRGPRLAQAWAEEPYRMAWEAERAERLAREAERAAKAKARSESKAQGTWGDLPPDRRSLRPKQVWARKGESMGQQQVQILEVRKATVVVRARSDRTAWGKSPTDVRDIRELLRLYRFLEEPRG